MALGSRQLIIDARSGLCNRLCALLSGIALAKRFGRGLKLCWEPDWHCCAFEELFECAIEQVEPPKQRVLLTERKLIETICGSDEPSVLISTYTVLVPTQEFCPSVEWFDKVLRPVAAVRDRVAQVEAQFGPPVAGVHVRRGDFSVYLPEKCGLALPPAQLYIDSLRSWEGHVFLATDDGASGRNYGVEAEFRRHFGDRLIVYPKRTLRRTVVEGPQDALVDLLLLRRCCFNVGTHKSTFSYLGGFGKPGTSISLR